MNLLLDTHTFLWFAADDANLSQTAKQMLEDEENQLYLSYASLWEIAIKVSLGKLHIVQNLDSFMGEQLSLNDIDLLQFSVTQIAVVVTLPFHHRDPFDRMLAAQALTEKMPLVSKDAIFDQYDVQRLW